MNKVLAFVIVILSFFVLGSSQVAAQDYNGSTSINVVVAEDQSATVTQTINLTNTSNQFLISHLEFGLPFKVKNLVVTANGVPVSARLNGRNLIINLGSKSIRLGSNVNLKIEYKVNGLIKDEGFVQSIQWPRFKFSKLRSKGGVKIYYPESWGEITYATREYKRPVKKFALNGIQIDKFQDVFFMTGNLRSVGINADWAVPPASETEESQVRIALPSPLVGRFSFIDNLGSDIGYFDAKGNSFLVKKQDPNQALEGNFSGVFDFNNLFLNPTSVLDVAQEDINYIKQPVEPSIEKLYDDVLRRLTPSKNFGFEARQNIESTITKPEHTSIDYANVLSASLKKFGIPTEVIYGYVYFPLIDDYSWHYWVVYEQDGQFYQIDPFTEDLLSLDQFNSITPGRIPWGILGHDDDGSDLGIQYISTDSLFNYGNNEVLGTQFSKEDIFVSMEILDEVYSGVPLNLQISITNSSVSPLSIGSVEVENFSLDSEDLKHYWLVPKSNLIIPVNSITLEDPFYTGQKQIKGKVVINTNAGSYDFDLVSDVKLEVDRDRLITNFVVFFVVLSILSLSFRYLGSWRLAKKLTRIAFDRQGTNSDN